MVSGQFATTFSLMVAVYLFAFDGFEAATDGVGRRGRRAMNPEHLLQHFERISEAPDAIPRLRRFILDLAGRGKLVEQDPHDETASELLKLIQAEKAQLVKEGKIRKEKSLPAITASDSSFDLP